MITRINDEPIIESVISNPEDYSTGYGFYQIGYDLIKEEGELMQSLIRYEMKKASCIDESSLIALQEANIKSVFTRLSDFIKNFIEKFNLAFQRAIAKFQTNITNFRELKSIKLVNKRGGFNDSDDTIEIDHFKVAINEKVTIATAEFIKVIDVISKYVDNNDFRISESDIQYFTEDFIKTIAYGGTLSDKSLNEHLSSLYTEKIKIKRNSSDIDPISDQILNAVSYIKAFDGSRKNIISKFQSLNKKVNSMMIGFVHRGSNKDLDEYIRELSKGITLIISWINRYYTAMIKLTASTTSKMANKLIPFMKKSTNAKNKSDVKESTFWSESVEGEGPDDDKPNPSEQNDDDGDMETNNVKEEMNMFDNADDSLMEAFWNEPFLESELGDDIIEPTGDNPEESEIQVDAENDQYDGDPADDDAGEEFMKDDEGTRELSIESQFII